MSVINMDVTDLQWNDIVTSTREVMTRIESRHIKEDTTDGGNR